jgi:hypothetical protein
LCGKNADKATLFADPLAAQCAPHAYQVADEVLCGLTFFVKAKEQLKSITIVEDN